ncbi:hypothetical protein BHE74_00043899 [Ensete ventricosum]|nr:hypothetical protein BHE74_00043899 [Ensete ventricosum]
MNRFFSSPELCLSQKPATAQKREPPIKESRREKKKDTNLPEEVAAAVVQMTPELPLPRAAPKVEGRCPVTSSASVRAEAGGGASAAVIGFGFGLQPEREPPPSRSAPTPLRLHLAGHMTDAARAYPAREHPLRWPLGGDASSLRRLAAALPPLQRLQEVPQLLEFKGKTKEALEEEHFQTGLDYLGAPFAVTAHTSSSSSSPTPRCSLFRVTVNNSTRKLQALAAGYSGSRETINGSRR